MSRKRKAQSILKKCIGETINLSLYLSAVGMSRSMYYGSGVLRGIKVWYFVSLPSLTSPNLISITISPELDPWSQRSTRFDFWEGDRIKISNEEFTLFILKVLL